MTSKRKGGGLTSVSYSIAAMASNSKSRSVDRVFTTTVSPGVAEARPGPFEFNRQNNSNEEAAYLYLNLADKHRTHEIDVFSIGNGVKTMLITRDYRFVYETSVGWEY